MIIQVEDINDNPPKFLHKVFTGGVSTATTFGTKFMHLKAEDKDIGENSVISYYQVGKIQMTLTEGLDNLQRPPFLVEHDTGAIQLNFDPQRGMKGYFDFMVNILLCYIFIIGSCFFYSFQQDISNPRH